MSYIKQSGLLDLLKEGTSHIRGVEAAVLRNIEACKNLTGIVRTSMGPNGKKKMVINHLGKLFVTSDAATIIGELEVVHPAAKLLVMASEMQERECGDGTNSVLVLGGELLIQSESLLRMGLHQSDIVAGFKKAAKKTLEILADEEALPSVSCGDVRSKEEVQRFVRSAVSSKTLGYEDFVAELISDACVSILPPKQEEEKEGKALSFNVDDIRTVKILGKSVLDSHLVHGFVVRRAPEGNVRKAEAESDEKPVRVAVYSVGLDAAKTETKGVVRLSNKDELLDFSVGEDKGMDAIISGIAATGVKVVVAGGNVSDLALHYIEKAGIMVVKVQSKFDLRRLCRAIGATPLVRLSKPSLEELGEASSVRTLEVGGTTVTVFRKPDARLSTLVLRGATNNVMDDLERTVNDGVNCFKNLLRFPRFVAGAGATEMELSKLLYKFGESQSELDQYSVKKFAEALEIVPRILADNSGFNSIDLLSKLQAAHQAEGDAAKRMGVNVLTGQVEDALEKLDVRDSVKVKANAVQLAVDAAITILKIDQLIVAKAAGGPKPPQPGPMDL